MKYACCTLLFVLMASQLFAQFYASQYDVITRPCDSDTLVTVIEYKNWEVYQTLNDHWDGERDETNCITLQPVYFAQQDTTRFSIDLSSVDHNKSIFIRYRIEDNAPVVYEANQIHNISGFITYWGNASIDYSTNCPNNLCTGLTTILKLEEDGDVLRKVSQFKMNSINYIESCFVTEKVEENVFEEVFYKVTFEQDQLVDSTLQIYAVSLYEQNMAIPLAEDIYIPENFYNNNSYDLAISDLFPFTGQYNYLLLHHEDGLPADDNKSYTYVRPQSDVGEAEVINLYITEFENLQYQMFSILQGGGVDGNDSLHHTLNIINDSYETCILIVERIFERQTNFVYESGTVNFNNPSSCFQFRNNGNLVVGEDKHFKYGQAGAGILNLRSGSTIVLRDQSRFTLDTKLLLNRYDTYNGDQRIFVDLPEGSYFGFTEHASIDNQIDGLQLNIRMKGGELDISELSVEDQRKINLIYEESISGSISLYLAQNPTRDKLSIQNPALETINELQILSLNGQLIESQKALGNPNEISIQTADFNTGIYIIKVITDKGISQLSVVIAK